MMHRSPSPSTATTATATAPLGMLSSLSSLPPALQQAIRARPLNTVSPQEDPIYKNLNIRFPSYMDYTDVTTHLPEAFDGCEVWKELLVVPQDQGPCGACWAFASVGSLADRFNVLLGRAYLSGLSPTRMLRCNRFLVTLRSNHTFNPDVLNRLLYACHGNTLEIAVLFLMVQGAVSIDCDTYTSKSNDDLFRKDNLGCLLLNPQEATSSQNTNPETEQEYAYCKNIGGFGSQFCNDFTLFQNQYYGTPARTYGVGITYVLRGRPGPAGTEEAVRYEILKWGPVCTTMTLYSDFYTFDPRKEIYSRSKDAILLGGHAVEIVGWGVDVRTRERYWQVKNSWGPGWGRNGYFWIRRGTDECSIETNVVCMLPDFDMTHAQTSAFVARLKRDHHLVLRNNPEVHDLVWKTYVSPETQPPVAFLHSFLQMMAKDGLLCPGYGDLGTCPLYKTRNGYWYASMSLFPGLDYSTSFSVDDFPFDHFAVREPYVQSLSTEAAGSTPTPPTVLLLFVAVLLAIGLALLGIILIRSTARCS